ncbi:MAG: chemotaxis protein CheW [Chromatiales bacterium]|nr:chemotaxis protein CheW [Chromatiales bacterium]
MSEAAVIDSSYEIIPEGSTGQYLTFILADEEYGVDILRVQEIKGWDDVTPIPNTPACVKGVINLRGAIVPIVDLRSRFKLDELEYGPTTVMIILKVRAGSRERIMGVVVDAVSEVYNIDGEELQPPPEFGGVINVEFIRGLASVEEKMIIVLDIDHLLDASEMQQLGAIAQQASKTK